MKVFRWKGKGVGGTFLIAETPTGLYEQCQLFSIPYTDSNIPFFHDLRSTTVWRKDPWGQLLGKPGTWKYSFWRLIPIFSFYLFFESSNIFKILVIFFIWPYTLATFYLKYMLINCISFHLITFMMYFYY